MIVKELIKEVRDSDTIHFADYVDVWHIDTGVTHQYHRENLGIVCHYTVCEIHVKPSGEIDAISIKR